jgi:hypothetical protein
MISKAGRAMSEYSDGSTLHEATTGRWHRLEKGIKKGTFLIEFSDTLLINVHVNAKSIHLLMRDGDIFRNMGDFSFEGLEDHRKFLFYSLGIDHVHFNNGDIRVDNPDCSMSTVFVKVSHDKRKETEDKLLGL